MLSITRNIFELHSQENVNFIARFINRHRMKRISISLEHKGIVSVFSSDLQFLEWNVLFTPIPFKPLFDQGYQIFLFI